MKSTNNLILYREPEENTLFYKMTWLMEQFDAGFENEPDAESLFYECLQQLIGLAEDYGWEGNLWHDYLAFLIANNENAYSRACEMRGEIAGSLNAAATHDFAIIRDYFHFDLKKIGSYFEVDCMEAVLNYTGTGGSGSLLNKNIRDRIGALSRHLEQLRGSMSFKAEATEFYKEVGVGKFGLHKAFRIGHNKDGAEILPINNTTCVDIDDLIGYEIAKKKLLDNTEAFVSGRVANNCLLYGDAGTGKSTSIKAIANKYYDRGLRLIEVYKHQFVDLHDVIAQIKNRNYKFILFMDDLSFEEFETDYKYLKAVIEGGLEQKPENVLIYATSNRRHLVRETYADKEEIRVDMHTSDTVQEKLSLSGRFGVTIYFGAPSQKEFQEIVKALAKKYRIKMNVKTLLAEANKWELSHGGRTGRTAQQFIDYLAGQ